MSLYYCITVKKAFFAYQIITKEFVQAQCTRWHTVKVVVKYLVLSTHPFLFNLTLCRNPNCPETNFWKLRNLQKHFKIFITVASGFLKSEKTLIFNFYTCISLQCIEQFYKILVSGNCLETFWWKTCSWYDNYRGQVPKQDIAWNSLMLDLYTYFLFNVVVTWKFATIIPLFSCLEFHFRITNPSGSGKKK